jgi:tRNA (guanine37-N1)-methyltransferase
MMPGPIFAAVEELKQQESDTRVILMTPQGIPFKQSDAQRLSSSKHLIILCGHYEGVDHRVIESLVDEEVSIGDYVLTNGAIAAAVVTDAITRLIPGALGDARSPEEESFTDPNRLEAPAYTKPNDVLLSGDHGKIEIWKKEQALARTKANRPDLLGG